MSSYKVFVVWSKSKTDLQEVTHIIEECDVYDVSVLNTAECDTAEGAVFKVELNPEKASTYDIEMALDGLVEQIKVKEVTL